ncbi:MAG: NAD(P)-dependent oxidoreductase [Firmicutes bacterium]|nr:NAD(P)-dependent oxidoreductase [Bacillota bacterium]
MSGHVLDEINRCLNCRKPACRQGCPINTPIPQMIRLLKEHRPNEAGEMLFDNNPLSLICSIVCMHEKQCEGHCVLGRTGSAVQISSIENYISDTFFDKMQPELAPPNGIAVAVIGSGPAGITVAVEMARRGYSVTIFEAKDKIGGVMQYGIPDFRLPKSILKRYKQKLESMGITIRLNTTIGNALSIDNLFRDDYRAVFIGSGVWRARTLGVKGESRGNVRFGLDYLSNPGQHELGEEVAIIGMGNTAMDVARTALRRGSKKVTLYSNMLVATAAKRELTYAQLDGAELEFGKQLVEINEKGPVFRDVVFNMQGDSVGLQGDLQQVEADSVVIAVSQGPRRRLVDTTPGLQVDASGFLVVDDQGQTTKEMVFAAGDVVTGPMNVVTAVTDSKRVAANMDRMLQEQINQQ